MLVFIGMFIVIIMQLANLQLFSSEYKIMADMQGTFRKVIYPDRGIVYDRKGRPILQNTTIYDLMVTPNKVRGIDTVALCQILNITEEQFNKKIVELILKNSRTRPSTFEALLSQDKMAMLNESMYKFAPAFYLQERSVRSFPFDAAANVLGYTAEVDTNFLKYHKDEGYVSGDYAGKTGIEKIYEKALMGERGIEYWKRDNKNRLTEKSENGRFDTVAVAGQNMHSYIDIELQELGEKLMQNKIGSIVAIDPKTGGILAMVSAPTYKPTLLTGSQRRKHLNELYRDPAKPLLNRAVNAAYSPGSTFKTLQALIGLHEGAITTGFSVSCHGAYYGCGRPMKCLDFGTFDLRHAITVSDNTYFANVMERVINNPKYPSVDSSTNAWRNYMNAFGLGKKLGVDVPTERNGFIPGSPYFDKLYGANRWKFCQLLSMSIGQGEVNTTPIQVANEMCYLANKGWFITPHIVDSIEGGDKFGLLAPYREKHHPIDIPDSIFEAVHDGMQGVMERGTGAGAKVPGVVVCGKTGTVENYIRGVKQPNHSFFTAFAPRDNPKIAIMCVVENSGRFGGTYAAPIVSLMIEKYLNDSITDKARLARLEQLAKTNLIPPSIAVELKRLDSLDHARDTGYLVQKGYINISRDTLGIEEDVEVKAADVEKLKQQLKQEEEKRRKDSLAKRQKIEAILPDNKKKTELKDSVPQ
ncbi:MAG: penicillin-binding protein 2 [Ferruginibacter sp.]|nr:penicillin-binding protein 2 [Ferruginibacter sp.]